MRASLERARDARTLDDQVRELCRGMTETELHELAKAFGNDRDAAYRTIEFCDGRIAMLGLEIAKRGEG